ncbi:MAG: hypothetical protein IK134_02345 [Oscillospiraceae bacterium]|nr:hypothetical protein [Oscillospiraceae bacterium]
MNYFAEGLQGSGKSTLVRNIEKHCSGCTVFREGDYNPAELAWCAYTDERQYRDITERYPKLLAQIEANTFAEDDRRIICYTKIRTDDDAFYQDLESYEIYNGRIPFSEFRSVILRRFANLHGDNMVFECALFQNIIEDMILFRNASDADIIDFYRQIRRVLEGRAFRILYLKTENVRNTIDAVRKERVDEKGEEVWFRMLCGFFDESPYAKANRVSGADALIAHLAHRQELELQICRGLFPGQYTVLSSKAYTDAELAAAL